MFNNFSIIIWLLIIQLIGIIKDDSNEETCIPLDSESLKELQHIFTYVIQIFFEEISMLTADVLCYADFR